ncbi:hypothetical protein MUP77_09365 [Candidatus Bathyarchaeota archaeon]|nr:hypothetical protein [Candidatus Bathyarchaeota archaeon]
MRGRPPIVYRGIVDAVKLVLAESETVYTVRQMFYQLVSRKTVGNTEKSYKTVSRALTDARENREISPERFEDRNRRAVGDGDFYDGGNSEDYFKGIIESVPTQWKYFHKSRWISQPYRVIIALEKEALSGLVAEIAEDYNIRTYPSKGYGSFSYVNNLAKECRGKHTVVLYLGDFDPSGLNIERNLWERLQRYGANSFEVVRVALTLEQIREYQLPPLPAKKSDSRFDSFVADTGGADVVELDALPPKILQTLLKDAIEAHIDEDEWNGTVNLEKGERERLRQMLLNVEIKTN